MWEVRAVEPGPATKAYPDGSIRVTVQDTDHEAILLFRPTQDLLVVGTPEWDAFDRWLSATP